MGTQKLPNITSISIRQPPTHEKAARATFFPYGKSDPEQLCFPTVEMQIYPQNTMKNTQFDDRFRYLLDPFRGAVLGSVCCLCKGQLSAWDPGAAAEEAAWATNPEDISLYPLGSFNQTHIYFVLSLEICWTTHVMLVITADSHNNTNHNSNIAGEGGRKPLSLFGDISLNAVILAPWTIFGIYNGHRQIYKFKYRIFCIGWTPGHRPQMLKNINTCDFVFFVAPDTLFMVLFSHTVNWPEIESL